MNNKGFSLVELLAVIILIGVLGTIAVVSYTSITDNVERKVYTTYEDTMKGGAMMYVIEKGIPSDGKITLNSLLTEQLVEEFTNPETDSKCLDSYVMVTAKNGDKTDLSYKACLICDNYRSNGC